jgi:16S rRNA (guanine527-N7)-methyltransferase
LKGGELQHEILSYRNRASMFDIKDFFEEEFFQTKKAVFVPVLG